MLIYDPAILAVMFTNWMAMSNANKALFAGFVIGAVILGAVGLLLAPHLLGIAGVGVGHAITQNIAVNAVVLHVQGWSAGVTAAVFGQLQAGIAVFIGLIGGLAGGLIGVKNSKKENNSTLQQHTSLSSVAPVNNYSPSLDVDGQTTKENHVERYKQEKLESLQAPSQWRM